MKKNTRRFLVILSLFVCLFTSCGIPNYFGNISTYVIYNGDRLRINNKKLSDGFNPEDIEPKLMFLYTIYSYDKAKDSLSTVQEKLRTQFINDFKLAEYDYKGCPDFGDRPVTEISIKDSENMEIEHKYGLYQLKTTGDRLHSSNQNYPTNYSSDYLFNIDNMNFQYNKDYSFEYTVESVDGTDNVRLVITCLDDDRKPVSSYYMGNYRGNDFLTKFNTTPSPDYEYAGQRTNLYILPVLYLESSKYSNRQMMVGSWKEVPLKQPDKKKNPNYR